jgi:predicted ATP-dependent protease
VQAIGGVNEKIEGFFAVCKVKGLNGEQGVMIPVSNVCDLMLKQEVVDAVQAGNFHIWSVASIQEGIEVLTSLAAGRNDDGTFASEGLFARVDQRLTQMAEELTKFASK